MSKKVTSDSAERLYELAFLLKEPAAEKVITDIINRYKAAVIYKPPLKDIKLAYPIKKYLSAFFGFIQFKINPQDIQKIRESLKLEQSALRFLIIIPSAAKEKEIEKKTEIKRGLKKEDKEISPKKVLTNEALEKTLEEILK